MNNYKIHTHYAKALLLLAIDTDCVDEEAKDMRLVSRVCAENHLLNVVFGNPVIPLQRKLNIVTTLFEGKVSATTLAFLLFATRKNRSVNLRGIAESYLRMFRDYRGIVLSDLVTHQPIDDVARRMVTEKVERYTGKTVELHDRTDEKMLGCFKLEFDGKMYDARIRTKIRRLRAQFARNDYESKL